MKTSRDTTSRGRGRGDRGGKLDRGGGRGRGAGRGGNSNLIQTTGVFSEGAGAIAIRRSTSSSYNRSSDDGSPSVMRKPTLVKRETKIDVKAEAQHVRDILGESDDDDLGNDEKTDLDRFPIKLTTGK